MRTQRRRKIPALALVPLLAIPVGLAAAGPAAAHACGRIPNPTPDEERQAYRDLAQALYGLETGEPAVDDALRGARRTLEETADPILEEVIFHWDGLAQETQGPLDPEEWPLDPTGYRPTCDLPVSDCPLYDTHADLTDAVEDPHGALPPQANCAVRRPPPQDHALASRKGCASILNPGARAGETFDVYLVGSSEDGTTRFEPPHLAIQPCDRVRWWNLDAVWHTSTELWDGPYLPLWDPPVWDSENIDHAQAWPRADASAFQFVAAGTFEYECKNHAWIPHATIDVVE